MHADEVTLGRKLNSASETSYTLLSVTNATVEQADGSQKTDKNKDLYYNGESYKTAATNYRTTIDGKNKMTGYDDRCYAGFKLVVADGYKLTLNNIVSKIAASADVTYKLVISNESEVLYTSNDKTIKLYKTNVTDCDFTESLNKIELKGIAYIKVFYYYTESTSKYIVPIELSITGDLTQINTNQLAAPSIEYTEDGLVTIKKNDSRTSKIYYTTDGTEPSATNGTEYTVPFPAPGKTVKAIAVGDGYDASTVAEKDVPKKATGTVVSVSKVTVDGTAISDADLNTLVSRKTITLTNKYSVAPAVVFTKTTTTNYNDGSKDSNDEAVDATVTEGTDSFVATATIGDDKYTINLLIDKSPVINADVTSFDFSVKRADIATQVIKFSAVNTSGVLNVNVTQVTGLSVKMTHVVTGADNKQKDEELKSGAEVKEDEIITMTVSYQSDVVVEKASGKITIAVGETTLDIPFTYEDTEDMISTIEDVTGDMTWNFDKIASSTINSPRPLEVVPYDNAEGFVESFGSKYLKAQAQNFYREGYQCYQGTELVFHTTVPGHVKIEFSNPNNKSTRTAKINGVIRNENGHSGQKGEAHVYAEADVPAGDVTIQGWLLKGENGAEVTQDFSQLRIYNIEFTAAKTASIEITAAKMATYSNASAWEVPEGMEVYTATYAEGKVKLNKVTETVIPANTGVVLYGEPKTYTANLATSAADLTEENNLEGTTEDVVMNNETTYVLVKGSDGKVCFGRLKSGETVKAGKAYLTISDPSAAKQLSIDLGGETTGINAVENATEAQNDVYYTLGGQRTVKPLKGLYIHNGKKYMK